VIDILFALTNGVLIALARALNGRLASQRDAFYASWINHLVGFAALSLLVMVTVGVPANLSSIPTVLYLGGMIGALYVSLNSYIVPKLGVTIATLLVIAGQLLMSVVLDIWLGKIGWQVSVEMGLLIGGCLLIVLGFYLMLKKG
jgi:transporter family-2 protein